jgi:hypothetical protein
VNLLNKIDLYLTEFNPDALKKPWTDTLNAQKQLRKWKSDLAKKYKNTSPEEHKQLAKKLAKKDPAEAEYHKSAAKQKANSNRWTGNDVILPGGANESVSQGKYKGNVVVDKRSGRLVACDDEEHCGTALVWKKGKPTCPICGAQYKISD